MARYGLKMRRVVPIKYAGRLTMLWYLHTIMLECVILHWQKVIGSNGPSLQSAESTVPYRKNRPSMSKGRARGKP